MQQDLQTAAILLVNSWPLHSAASMQPAACAELVLPLLFPHRTLALLSGTKKHWQLPPVDSADFLGHCEGTRHYCPSAPSLRSLNYTIKWEV